MIRGTSEGTFSVFRTDSDAGPERSFYGSIFDMA